MRKLFLFFGTLFLSTSTFGSGAWVSSAYCHGATASFTCAAFSPNNTSGNSIVVTVIEFAVASAPTVTDSKNGSIYGSPKATCSNTSSSGYTVFVFEGDSIASGANTVTIASGNTNVTEGFATEVSGLASSAFDQYSCGGGTNNTTLSSGATPTTSFANEYVLGFAGTNRSPTGIGSGGYTQRASNSFNDFEILGDQNLTSIGAGPSFGPTVGIAGTYESVAVTLKASSQPSGSVRRRGAVIQ